MPPPALSQLSIMAKVSDITINGHENLGSILDMRMILVSMTYLLERVAPPSSFDLSYDWDCSWCEY